jgi:hypothetical protein
MAEQACQKGLGSGLQNLLASEHLSDTSEEHPSRRTGLFGDPGWSRLWGPGSHFASCLPAIRKEKHQAKRTSTCTLQEQTEFLEME